MRVPDSRSNGAWEVTVTWVPGRMPTPPFFDSDYRIHLISANGQVGRSLTTSDGARLAAGSASPSGNKLLIIDGRPNFYLSAISAAGLHTHLYNRLTQLTR